MTKKPKKYICYINKKIDGKYYRIYLGIYTSINESEARRCGFADHKNNLFLEENEMTDIDCIPL